MDNGNPTSQVALEIWRALVDGRWSIVQHEDKGGKRVLLARKNPSNRRHPSALRPLERHVVSLVQRGHSSKVIAYELGISASAVSQRLASALRKLGLSHLSELSRCERAVPP